MMGRECENGREATPVLNSISRKDFSRNAAKAKNETGQPLNSQFCTKNTCRCYNDVLQKATKENSEQEQPVLQLSYKYKTERQVSSFAMNKITQTMYYRQSLIKYAKKFGVTKAAIHYRENRQLIYRWMKRYDGALQSLADRSPRPHSHPNQHNQNEIKLILDMQRRNVHTDIV